MKILGIDPGTATTGFAIIEKRGGGVVRALDYGVITTLAGLPMEQRLVELAQDLEALLSEYKPEVAVVEQLFFANNQKTVITVAQARGVVLLALARAGCRIVERTPLQVKQVITGYGKADKKQVQAMVQRIFGLAEVPRPDDAADALALAYAGG